MPQFEKVIGSFQCWECKECANEAEYDNDEGVLYWTCPNGHMNKAKMKI